MNSVQAFLRGVLETPVVIKCPLRRSKEAVRRMFSKPTDGESNELRENENQALKLRRKEGKRGNGRSPKFSKLKDEAVHSPGHDDA
ncbi:hypothetical protein CDAR_262531 [Caerostris darwini]|uniref:Uncharacterized protein n=1 Tax=Caerostris darwini TaxID=1538125 RepID=A0AAV4RHY2_9ARAC|nr:hypothetical protein CDAR_262531 [Caerostris darwini]